MEEKYFIDMSNVHLSVDEKVAVKIAERALRDLDYDTFRVWFSIICDDFNPQQIMDDFGFSMEQINRSISKLEKKGYLTPTKNKQNEMDIHYFPEKKEKVILSRNVAAKLVDRGYSLLREEANRRDPTRKVYIFPWSEEIETDLLTVLAERAQYYNK